jgi:hypothetical protein
MAGGDDDAVDGGACIVAGVIGNRHCRALNLRAIQPKLCDCFFMGFDRIKERFVGISIRV